MFTLLYVRRELAQEPQPLVIDDICERLVAGQKYITGVMIKSHINEDHQDVPPERPQNLNGASASLTLA